MKEYFVGIFENDEQAPLNYLDDERKAIDLLLLKHKEVITKEIIPNEGIDGFIGKLQLLTSDMTIFHFSGHHHSNDETEAIKLSDEIFNDKGLIDILNNSPKLKMVFINGCSTQKIVDALHNVPIVIGTSTPVYDNFANTLSTQFYNLLLNEKGNLNYSEKIDEAFKQAKGFLKGHYKSPIDEERGPGAEEDIIDKKVNNYLFKINRNAKDFGIRIIYPYFELYPLKDHFQKIINEIRTEENLREDLYKYYPYFLCIHLEILSDYNDPNNSVYHKLGKERYWVIRSMFKEFLNFLKFSAYSIIWSISKEQPEFRDNLSTNLKGILRDNLEIGWGSHVQDKISEDLFFMYNNIPDEYLNKVPLWKELKTCVIQNREVFKEISDFFASYVEHNESSKNDYIKTEFYLEKFLRNFKFLRSLGVEFIYDVFYNQFKYDNQRSFVINRSYFPVINRPTSFAKKREVFEVIDGEPALDIDIHSVYICTQSNNGKPKRELNLSPFYLDVNSASIGKDRIKLYYLDRYSEATDALIYKEVINEVDRESNSGNNILGEEFMLHLCDDDMERISPDSTKDVIIKIELEEKKKIRDHFEYIKNLISNT